MKLNYKKKENKTTQNNLHNGILKYKVKRISPFKFHYRKVNQCALF